MGIGELAYLLLGHGEEGTIIMSFAENARNEWGHSRFAVIEASQGTEVADAARFVEEAWKNRVRCNELQKTVESLNVKKGELLAQLEGKQTLRIAALEVILNEFFSRTWCDL